MSNKNQEYQQYCVPIKLCSIGTSRMKKHSYSFCYVRHISGSTPLLFE